MARHEANAAIFLSASQDGLAREIGIWAFGECEYGLWVATTHELLTVAIQFLVVRQQLTTQQAFSTKLDTRAIEAQMQQIQSSLNYVNQINTHLTHLQEQTEGIRLFRVCGDKLNLCTTVRGFQRLAFPKKYLKLHFQPESQKSQAFGPKVKR